MMTEQIGTRALAWSMAIVLCIGPANAAGELAAGEPSSPSNFETDDTGICVVDIPVSNTTSGIMYKVTVANLEGPAGTEYVVDATSVKAKTTYNVKVFLHLKNVPNGNYIVRFPIRGGRTEASGYREYLSEPVEVTVTRQGGLDQIDPVAEPVEGWDLVTEIVSAEAGATPPSGGNAPINYVFRVRNRGNQPAPSGHGISLYKQIRDPNDADRNGDPIGWSGNDRSPNALPDEIPAGWEQLFEGSLTMASSPTWTFGTRALLIGDLRGPGNMGPAGDDPSGNHAQQGVIRPLP